MTEGASQEGPTRLHLRTAAKNLEETASAIDATLRARFEDVPAFIEGSSAAADASILAHGLVETMLSVNGLLLAAALDHATALVTWAESAADGEPTPVWAPWSVARSLVEVCAPIPWLTEDRIDPLRRAARALTYERSTLGSGFRDGEHVDLRINEIAGEAARLGLPSAKARTGPYYGEEAMPSRTELVRDALPTAGDFDTYGLLSAASHGEPWAIQEMGYEEKEQVGGHVVFEKRPTVRYLLLATALAHECLETASRADFTYRGWH